MEKLLQIENLTCEFTLKSGFFTQAKVNRALDNISIELFKGEILGIVGESGCGKSTLAKTLVGINPIIKGSVKFKGQELKGLSARRWRPFHRQIQLIFQDPISSLNPRMTIAEIILEPLKNYYPKFSNNQLKGKLNHYLDLVGISKQLLNHYPSELSGGQCQRVNIARALIIEPTLLICDEAVSALDASIKAQIINLLKDIQEKLQITIIFISHDLNIVRHLCSKVAVIHQGQVVEINDTATLFANPNHSYTQKLLSANLNLKT